MPTLRLRYDAYVDVKVPKKYAKKLMTYEYMYSNKWGTIFFKDENGKEVEIAGIEGGVDYKRAEDEEWVSDSESEGESESEEEEGDEKCDECNGRDCDKDCLNPEPTYWLPEGVINPRSHPIEGIKTDKLGFCKCCNPAVYLPEVARRLIPQHNPIKIIQFNEEGDAVPTTL